MLRGGVVGRIKEYVDWEGMGLKTLGETFTSEKRGR